MALTLKDVHEKLEEIAEPFRELYTEKNGKWELTGIAGVKTSADIARVQESLTKERNDHKATKAALSAWGELKPDEVTAKLDRMGELELAAKGKIDEAKIEEIVQKRVEGTLRSKLTPVERENGKLKELLANTEKEVGSLKGEKRTRTIHDAVRRALTGAKARPEAEEDALLLAERVFDVSEEGKPVTRDGVGVTPGLDPAAWLAEIQPRRQHWWPPSVGGGGRGSGPSGGGFGTGNPWTADGWNVTEQGKFLREHGKEKAEAAAKAAGTKLGAGRPQPAKK
jgi:hypothetical protein